jgi:N,N'-diacetyllegionaminate synthase
MIINNSTKFKKLLKKEKTVLVAEIGQAHDGSLNIAHAMIDACANAKVDVVKFQAHVAEAESTLDEPFRIKFSYKDRSRFDYWKRMEFSFEEWKSLFNHAKKRGLYFMVSVFSEKAFEMINKLDVCAWKVSSGEISNVNLINRMIKTKKTIIISTGMSDNAEIKNTINFLKNKKAHFVILQCSTMYPTPLKYVGMNIVEEIKNKYKCLVGLSDHTGSVYPLVYGLSKKFALLEFHVTFHENMFGPDNSSSITFEELKDIVDFRKNFEILSNYRVDKNKIFNKFKLTKKIFGKSLSLKTSRNKNYIIKDTDLVSKKPGNGISPSQRNKIIGKKLKKNLSNNKLLRFDDFY